VLKGRTSVVIAHRLSTIINAEQIAVIKDGKLVSIGKHSELLKNNEVYADLYNQITIK
jgi:ABC-type transport system involved in Fe-S cluster assembly fused permease/ATPase subunit